jgi:hypothetical protein
MTFAIGLTFAIVEEGSLTIDSLHGPEGHPHCHRSRSVLPIEWSWKQGMFARCGICLFARCRVSRR